MSVSRVDELLEEWKMVARTERRPMTAPRPRMARAGLPIGILATAAIAIALLVALALRAGGPGPQASLPAVGASPTPSAPATTSPAPSPQGTAAPSPSQPPSGSAGTPTAADIGAARNAVDAYTQFLVQGDYAAAWALLGPEAQTHLGSQAAYASERASFFKNLGGRYTVIVSPTDVAPISAWLAGTYGAFIDLDHAVLVEVDYPALAGNNAGYDLFIVNQRLNGLFLRIYDVR
jgi:hypothetical protein